MFKPHYGYCSHLECTNPQGALIVVKKGWCERCNYNEKQKAKGDKAKKPYLAPLSDKREKMQRAYTVSNKIFLKHNPLCKAKIEGICHLASNQVHHMRGRIGDLLLDQKFWLPTCGPCHHYIENHPAEAIEKGWSLPRLTGE